MTTSHTDQTTPIYWMIVAPSLTGDDEPDVDLDEVYETREDAEWASSWAELGPEFVVRAVVLGHYSDPLEEGRAGLTLEEWQRVRREDGWVYTRPAPGA